MEHFTALQVEIQKTLTEINNVTKVNSHLSQVENQLNDLYSKIKKYEKKLSEDLLDIEKLEENSVKSLFHSVLGNKVQQLEKERQEYLETSLKFKEISKRIQLLEFEKELLEKKAKNIDSFNSKLTNLKNKRKVEILKNGDDKTKESLESLLIEIDRRSIVKRELHEAIVEGENCLKILNVVISYLKKARDWGKWNHKNNRRGAYMKNRSIDNAIKNLSKAQVRLDLFSKELSDLGDNYIRFDLSKAQFGQFTDFFFDNLISDWIVQQKIKTTINSVEAIIDKIQRILLGLKDENQKNNNELFTHNQHKDQILTA